MKTDLEMTKAVRELITDPAHWTQGAYERNADGIPCAQGAGVCFCINGAWRKLSNGLMQGFHPFDILLKDCVPKRFEGRHHVMSATFNDESTHEEVLAALDCAIEKLGARLEVQQKNDLHALRYQGGERKLGDSE